MLLKTSKGIQCETQRHCILNGEDSLSLLFLLEKKKSNLQKFARIVQKPSVSSLPQIVNMLLTIPKMLICYCVATVTHFYTHYH